MPVKKVIAALAVGSLICIAVLGFRAQATAQHEEKTGDVGGVSKALAQLIPTKGSSVKGTVTFTKAARGLHVHAEISGLTPGEHGFHVHEYGVWSENGMSTGGHFNPTAEEHAGPHSKKRHVGDMGNIRANANGNATLDLDDAYMSFHGVNSILGRGLVIHEKVDDLKSQPAGNAGARLAVGIIGVAKP